MMQPHSRPTTARPHRSVQAKRFRRREHPPLGRWLYWLLLGLLLAMLAVAMLFSPAFMLRRVTVVSSAVVPQQYIARNLHLQTGQNWLMCIWQRHALHRRLNALAPVASTVSTVWPPCSLTIHVYARKPLAHVVGVRNDLVTDANGVVFAVPTAYRPRAQLVLAAPVPLYPGRQLCEDTLLQLGDITNPLRVIQRLWADPPEELDWLHRLLSHHLEAEDKARLTDATEPVNERERALLRGLNEMIRSQDLKYRWKGKRGGSSDQERMASNRRVLTAATGADVGPPLLSGYSVRVALSILERDARQYGLTVRQVLIDRDQQLCLNIPNKPPVRMGPPYYRMRKLYATSVLLNTPNLVSRQRYIDVSNDRSTSRLKAVLGPMLPDGHPVGGGNEPLRFNDQGKLVYPSGDHVFSDPGSLTGAVSQDAAIDPSGVTAVKPVPRSGKRVPGSAGPDQAAERGGQ